MFNTIAWPGSGLVGRARVYEIVRCIVFWACVLLAAYWAADRKPPFAVLEQRATPARAGQLAFVELRVRRDMARRCAVSYQRTLYDAAGFRFDISGPPTHMSHEAIQALEQASPGRLLLQVRVPPRASTGPAHFVGSLEYVCNPLHLLWPIPLTVDVPIDVIG